MAATGPGAMTLPGPLPAGGRVPDENTAIITAIMALREDVAQTRDGPDCGRASRLNVAFGALSVALIAARPWGIAAAAVRVAWAAGRFSR